MSRRKDSEVRFETPPIVWGPSESLRWAVASNQPRKRKKKWTHKHEEVLDSPRLQITLDTEKRIVKARGIRRILGKKMVEDDIDIPETVEVLLRALSFAKFKNVLDITVDGEMVYSAPEEEKDVHHVIDTVNEMTEGRDIEEILIDSALSGKTSCHVNIAIRNHYRAGEPPIEIRFEGEVEKRQFNSFSNYLSKHFEIAEIE